MQFQQVTPRVPLVFFIDPLGRKSSFSHKVAADLMGLGSEWGLIYLNSWRMLQYGKLHRGSKTNRKSITWARPQAHNPSVDLQRKKDLLSLFFAPPPEEQSPSQWKGLIDGGFDKSPSLLPCLSWSLLIEVWTQHKQDQWITVYYSWDSTPPLCCDLVMWMIHICTPETLLLNYAEIWWCEFICLHIIELAHLQKKGIGLCIL